MRHPSKAQIFQFANSNDRGNKDKVRTRDNEDKKSLY